MLTAQHPVACAPGSLVKLLCKPTCPFLHIEVYMSLRFPRLVVFALALCVALPPIAHADDTVAQQGVKSAVWVIARLDGDRIMIGSGAVIDTGKKLVVTNYHLLVNS